MRRRSKRLLDTLPQRLSHSYSFLVLVFAVLGLLALDYATRKREEARPTPAQISFTSGTMSPMAIMRLAPWHFFHPLWSKQDAWTLFLKDQNSASLPTSSEDLSDYLGDPQGRIEKPFRVTSAIKKRVLFWVEIYAKYNSRIKVVHDRNDPGIIYGYIDLRPLYRAMGKGPLTESKANEIEKAVVKEMKARLTEAIDITEPNLLKPEERQEIRDFLSSVGALSPKSTMQLIENIRSQTGQRDEFLQALHRSSTLLPHIEAVLKQKGLPIALARVPFVESSFNARARSNVGAVGIWQFMPETARQMIHEDDEKVWADPIKQTASAAKLFLIYRSLLPDWSLTVTSYNSGVGRLKTLAAKYKVKNIDGLLKQQNLESQDGLGFAGQNFYAEFLAANIVEAYKEEIFKKMLGSIDLAMVFKGKAPFPKDLCEF